jgi:hypothetical protein
VASRRPENPVGRLLCLYGLVISISYFSAEYAIFTPPAQPNYMPAGEALACIASWMPPIINGITVFYILLFPTGRLPSRRWRWSAWLTAGFCPGGCFTGFVLFWSANGHSWPDPKPARKSARDRGLHQRLQKAVAYKMLPALTGAVTLSVFMRRRLRTLLGRRACLLTHPTNYQTLPGASVTIGV